MTIRSTFARAGLAAAAGVLALSAAATASAQPYGAYAGANAGGGYYDPCRRDSTGRGTVGALLGAGVGATIGSQLAARGHRTDGSALGGVLGAFAGAAIGNRSAACTEGARQPYAPPRSSYDYGRAPQYGYAQPYGAYGQPYGYDRRAERYGSRYDEDSYAYGRRGQRLRVAGGEVGADGCTLAESPIHMPDGRTQMRMVRVCMDSSGRYQVVD